jgi:hypothetical protein
MRRFSIAISFADLSLWPEWMFDSSKQANKQYAPKNVVMIVKFAPGPFP